MRSRLRPYSALFLSTRLSITAIASAPQHLGSLGEMEAVIGRAALDVGNRHRAVAERHAAIDADLAAGDVGRAVAQQEADDRRYLALRTEAAERRVAR